MGAAVEPCCRTDSSLIDWNGLPVIFREEVANPGVPVRGSVRID